jgi:WD40 repeat protein
LSIGSVAAVALAEDDLTVAIATITGDVVVREIGEGSRLTRLSVTAAAFKPGPFDVFARQSISAIAITSKHRLLAVGRVSGTVDVYRIEDSSKVASWKVSDDPIRALRFSPVDCELAIGTDSGNIVIQSCELKMTR